MKRRDKSLGGRVRHAVTRVAATVHVITLAAVAGFAGNSRSSAIGIGDLARAGDWQRVLRVATMRADQLPLTTEEALIAAHAARSLNDRASEVSFLSTVALSSDDELAALARVQLAERVVESDPGRAVELVVSLLAKAPSWEVREAAAAVAATAINAGVRAAHRDAVQHAFPRMPRGPRRRLELALARTDPTSGRHALEKLLAADVGDQVALEAANALRVHADLTPDERWQVARTLYRHALYEEAIPLLDSLDGATSRSVPADRVAFIRGRCAFRRGGWDEAVLWYRHAIAATRSSAQRAEIEVHLGRTFELAGDMDQAVAAAQRAVRLKTTDDRRLFLARLRLRRNEPELAAHGIARLKSRTHRARGQLMLAVHSIGAERSEEAIELLRGIRTQPWSGPAAVEAARLVADAGDAARAISILEDAALDLNEYWGSRARTVVASLPEAEVAKWHERVLAPMRAGGSAMSQRHVGRWTTLEVNNAQVDAARAIVADMVMISGQTTPPAFPERLAGRLWSLGLEEAAVHWDARGMPRRTAPEAAWSAVQFLRLGVPQRAVRAADGAWRAGAADLPVRVLPKDLRRAMHPLPEPGDLGAAAAAAGVPWPLLAAVALVESRWDRRVVSAVGARGLVQIMPGTAVEVARRLGETSPEPDALFDTRVNLRLGGAELGRLLDVFGGRRAPAIAAYNAGEAQARAWLDQCGAECTEDLFVLTISFAATRGYTAQVLAAAAEYEDLYSGIMATDKELPQFPIRGLTD